MDFDPFPRSFDFYKIDKKLRQSKAQELEHPGLGNLIRYQTGCFYICGLRDDFSRHI